MIVSTCSRAVQGGESVFSKTRRPLPWFARHNHASCWRCRHWSSLPSGVLLMSEDEQIAIMPDDHLCGQTEDGLLRSSVAGARVLHFDFVQPSNLQHGQSMESPWAHAKPQTAAFASRDEVHAYKITQKVSLHHETCLKTSSAKWHASPNVAYRTFGSCAQTAGTS
jgi:hypothetical protein